MTKKKKYISALLLMNVFIIVLIFESKYSIDIQADTIENVETTEEITTASDSITEEGTSAEPATTCNSVTETVHKPGFYKEDGYTYYYLKNGKRAVGFKKIKGKTYYFSQNGRMVKGFQKIKKSTYYFNKNGVMQTGFKKIKNNRYYFKKSGKMHCGFMYRKYKKQRIYNYFNKKGRLKTGTFTVKNITYKGKARTGKIYYVNNNVVPICQRPQLPTGCEITSWTMMVRNEGKTMDKITAANIMPRSGNPNYGFMGSPYTSGGHGLVVYPDGLSGITKRHLGNYINLTGCSHSRIRAQLRKGHLVLVWLNGLNGFCSHTVTLTGYDENYFYYNNPWTGQRERFSYGYFDSMWRGNGMRAMSY